MTKRLLIHIILPLIISIAFFVNAFTPVEVLGCRTRGIVAIIITFISAILALSFAIIALKRKLQKDENSYWWIISSLILTIPIIALLIFA
jgi:hypothetical protein